MAWASYHASDQNFTTDPYLALTQLMPLFYEKAGLVQKVGVWSLDDKTLSWTPVWTNLPIASKACAELIKCGCKSRSGCGARCGCKKANWTCTLWL